MKILNIILYFVAIAGSMLFVSSLVIEACSIARPSEESDKDRMMGGVTRLVLIFLVSLSASLITVLN